MFTRGFRVGLLTLVLLFCSKSYGLPETCLQAPKRQSACPHLIYKRAALAVISLNVEKNDVICICLSDFKALTSSTSSQLEKIDQEVTLQRVARKYQLKDEDIIRLIQN